MIPVMNAFFDIRPEVAEALSGGRPVVALESTLIAHGLPYPRNLEAARRVESGNAKSITDLAAQDDVTDA